MARAEEGVGPQAGPPITRVGDGICPHGELGEDEDGTDTGGGTFLPRNGITND